MRIFRRVVAVSEVLLVAPAAVFMTALFVRNITPLANEPSHTAQRIVLWFSHLPVHIGLWVLLMAMPLAVLTIGLATLVSSWRHDADLRAAAWLTVSAVRANFAAAVIAVATLAAAAFLAVIAVHALTD